MKLSIIIITLNEVDCISQVLEEIPKDIVDEILVVDGHSSDGTPELVRKLGYNVVMQEKKGYGMAFIEGARHARGDVLILMNGDGSQDPRYIRDFLSQLQLGHKVVFASRYAKGAGSEDDTLITYLGNKIFTFLTNVVHGVGISDSLFMYAAIDKTIFDSLQLPYWNFELCVAVPIRVHKKGYRFVEIPAFERKRLHGTKKVHAFLHGLRILWAIIKERFI
jgi:glycosyltransferase involved in cell wall biosynthesis